MLLWNGQFFDQSGGVTPTAPEPLFGEGALVVKSSNQTITTGTTATVATWATEVFDTGSFWSAGAPTKLIVPANGFAQVWGGARWETVTSATIRFCRPMLDGAVFFGGGGHAALGPSSASGARQCFMTPFVPVTAGQEFTMEVLHLRGSNLALNADNQTYFGIRFVEELTGTMARLTANESIAHNTPTYVPWDTTVYNTLAAWSAGDPTKLTVPTNHPHKLRLYAGTRWSVMGQHVFIDIDRDTGSRPGGSLEEIQTTSTGSVGTRQSVVSGLFRPEYDGASGEFAGFDSVPNDYLMQVGQDSGGPINLNSDAQTYFAMESVPGGKETLIRLASDRTILDTTSTVVDWGNLVEHDDYGIFDSGQSDRLIVPAGYTKALLISSISWDINGAFDRWHQFLKNGTTFQGGAGKFVQASNMDRTRVHLCTIVPVAENDYLQVQVWQNSGGDRTIVAGNTPCFSVQFFA